MHTVDSPANNTTTVSYMRDFTGDLFNWVFPRVADKKSS